MKKLSIIYDKVIDLYAQTKIGYNRPSLASSFISIKKYDPMLSITPNKSSVDEGTAIVFSVNAFNVKNGTTVYYAITGCSASDFVDNSLTGSCVINNNTGSFTKTLKADATTEGVENFRVELKTSPTGRVIKYTPPIVINDLSLTLNPTYAVNFNLSSVNEGAPIVCTLTTTDLAVGTSVPYTITGISAADIQESLTGSFVVDADGVMTKTFNVVADVLSEGVETMILTLNGVSPSKIVSATISDTSFNPRGEAIYTYGTSNFIVPTGITSVSVVCVGSGGTGAIKTSGGDIYSGGGGGGLGYKNNISVTPGQVIPVIVGNSTPYPDRGVVHDGQDSQFGQSVVYCIGRGGKGGGFNEASTSTGSLGGAGGTYVGDGGGYGGDGGKGGYLPGALGHAGAGGAGGYSGDGGRGSDDNLANNTAGSGGGGGGSNYSGGSSGAGGVGIYGQGASGAKGAPFGGGGSGGQTSSDALGGSYGGGSSTAPSGRGAVRVVWPGTTRRFPSTDIV